MKKKLFALLLSFAMLANMVPPLGTVAMASSGLDVYLNSNVVENVMVPSNGFTTLSAGGSVGSGYQWQIKASSDLWVDIQGENGVDINLSYAMVANLMTNGVATIRCSSGSLVSDEIRVTKDSSAPEFDTPRQNTEIVVKSEATVVENQPAATETESRDADMDSLIAEYEAADEAAKSAEDRYNSAVTARGEAEAALDEALAAETEAKSAYESAVATGNDVISDETEAIDEPQEDQVETVDIEVLKVAYDQAVQNTAAALANLEEKEAELTAAESAYNAALDTLDAITIQLTTAMEQQGYGVMAAEAPSEMTTYTVEVKYVFADGSQAAHSYSASVAGGSALDVTVNSPSIMGYTPDQAAVMFNEVNIQSDITVTVTYSPDLVSFTVNHYQQNIADDHYTLAESETQTGYTQSEVGDALAKSYDGFYQLLYDTTLPIAADGTTVVNIYYDRYYYLMNFDLGEGGYGVDPIYARYGAPISDRGVPSRPGYVFQGWTGYSGVITRIPGTMPAENRTYTARWETTAYAHVTVIFWGENANDGGYSYSHSGVIEEVPSNTVFDYSADMKVLTCAEEHSHTDNCYETNGGLDSSLWKFDHADSVTVHADDTSVVNVYYNRTEFTLLFKTNKNQTDAQAVYKITEKWGTNIGDHFPLDYTGHQDGERWDPKETYGGSGSETFPELLVYIDIMPAENVTFIKNMDNMQNKVLFTLNYFVEVLPGETGDYSYQFNGETKQFKKYTTVQAYYERVTKAEDFFDLVGFEQWTSSPEFQPGRAPYTPADGVYDILRDEAKNGNDYIVNMYYERQQYNVDFYNYSEELPDATQILYYEQPFGENLLAVPPYPDELEPGAYEFEGWYHENVFRNKATAEDIMPADNVILYANWVLTSHEVNFYLTEEEIATDNKLYDEQIIIHGNRISDVSKPERGNYIFVGWFYRDENGQEQAFSADSMTVRHDLNLYAKWSSNILMPYTIHYALDGDDDGVADTDSEGNVISIADPSTGSGLAGTTKVFDAKNGPELYAGYQAHYYPMVKSHAITFDIEGNNDWTFLYEYREGNPYVVRYLEAGTERVLHEEKSERTDHSIITEVFVQIDGYKPDAYQKRLVLSVTESENVITFWYEKDTVHAPLHVGHYTENIEGTDYDIYQERTDLNALIGTTYTEDPLTIPGFIYNAGKSNANGTMTAAGMDLKLYYDRIEYPYEFRFLEQGTDKVLAETVTGSAKYQTQVTEKAKEIIGYTLVSDESQSIGIAIEDPANTAQNNVRIFYYQEQEVTIQYVAVGPDGTQNPVGIGSVTPGSETVKTVTGIPAGSVASAASIAYKFAGWFKDEACTEAVDAPWVTDGKITPQKTGDVDASGTAQTYETATYYAKFDNNLTSLTIRKTGEAYDSTDTFIFDVFTAAGDKVTTVTLKLNGSITISGLTVGETYIVSERTSGTRYKAKNSINIELDEDASKNSMNFVNEIEEHKWLSISDSVRNIFNGIRKIG